MNKLFHYEMVKVLACKAGMEEDEAQTVAYASQFADDCAPPAEFYLDSLPPGVKCAGLYNEESRLFSPVRTAHKGLQYILSLARIEQFRVLLAFHFLPPGDFGGDEKSFRAQADGNLAGRLVNRAVNDLAEVNDCDMRQGRLIALGLALHSYADTWAHDDFSGIRQRYNKKNNCQVLRNGKWERDYCAGRFEIGHGESTSPDCNVTWRYRNRDSGEWVIKDNHARFLEAANRIYCILCRVTKSDPDFSKLGTSIAKAFEIDSPSAVFDDLVFDFNPNAWSKAALKIDVFKTVDRPSGQREWHYRLLGDRRWFLFQEAALAQRNYILGHGTRTCEVGA